MKLDLPPRMTPEPCPCEACSVLKPDCRFDHRLGKTLCGECWARTPPPGQRGGARIDLKA